MSPKILNQPKMNIEHQLIKTIKDSLGQAGAVIGDDCAVIDLSAGKYLFCLDNFTENTHFSYEYFSVEDIGWKSLAVNLSDISAHAGDPLFILVGLSLAQNISDKNQWMSEFYRGLNLCASKFGGAQVIGGDISASQALTSISVTVIGKANQADCLRSMAKPGDKIFVTGKFGNSASFLSGARQEPDNKKYHLRPEPRLELAKNLMQVNSRAALMDSSDGLVASLYEIASQSKVNLAIDLEAVPRDGFVTLEQALYGAEDYELVACAPKAPAGFKEIGVVVECSQNPRVFDLSQKLLIEQDKIYKHF
jgi:thiamine-monophosphate kinase